MRVQTRQAYHRCILQVMEQIVRSPGNRVQVADIAASVGFSPYHLNRLFLAQTGENVGRFARRIRLEKAAYLLQTTLLSITDIAYEIGYANPEVFARAFHTSFGLSPSEYRRQARPWRLGSASGAHWEENSFGVRFAPRVRDNMAVRILTRPCLRMAAIRYVGDYGKIAQAWERLPELFPDHPWKKPGSRLLTLYHDDGKAGRKASALRADIGFTVDADYAPPAGAQIRAIPGGQYACTPLLIGPEQHARAWDVMNDAYIPKTKRRPRNIPGMDEYSTLPVPWASLRARVLIGLEIDMGDV